MNAPASPWVSHPHLHRAIVALPLHMMCAGHHLQERVVFFMAPHGVHAATHLAEMLALAWGVDTREWCDRGYIYNVDSARMMTRPSAGAQPCANALQMALLLLETGFGGSDAVGPEGQHYARAADVDLFVTPRVAEQLHAALRFVETLYAERAVQQASAGAAA